MLSYSGLIKFITLKFLKSIFKQQNKNMLLKI